MEIKQHIFSEQEPRLFHLDIINALRTEASIGSLIESPTLRKVADALNLSSV
jgi:hypothetical protein